MQQEEDVVLIDSCFLVAGQMRRMKEIVSFASHIVIQHKMNGFHHAEKCATACRAEQAEVSTLVLLLSHSHELI